MVISDWFTVISILSAFLAFLIQNELRLFIAKLSATEKLVIGYVLLLQIPILLFYSKLSFYEYLKILNKPPFAFKWGIETEILAFILILILLAYTLFRLYWCVPINKISQSIYTIYSSIADHSPAHLPELIKKYERDDFINLNWKKYSQLFNDKMILTILIEKYPLLLYKIWNNFNTEREFQNVFRLFLENPNSAYYLEIEDNYSSIDDKPFLNTIIRDNLTQSINNGILMVFTDHVSKHLLSEYGKASIYNQEHYQPKTRESEGFELPMYFHICFIGLMYLSAIEKRIDISVISHKYTNMQSIYSNMVGKMVNNIILIEENAGKEFLSNYHWLIGEIFDWQSNWLTLFGDEGYEEERYFDANSSYISFIPFSMSLCLSELYIGLKTKKITMEFLNRKIYYNILSHYFNGLNDTLKASIEEKVIKGFLNELLKEILEFALDPDFGLSYNDFITERFEIFEHLEDSQKEILRRLLKFLRDNNKL